ncbi:MAG: OB-fold nucleic acid binding domain-containing protein [Nanoarchaeota archaeon]
MYVLLQIPLPQIKEKILASGLISQADLDKKIQAKLDSLSGLVSEEGAAHIVANELGIKLWDASAKLQVKNILAGMRNVEVIGKITAKYEAREFKTDKREGQVASFMLSDETGAIRTVLWNNMVSEYHSKMNQGDVVRLLGAYVKDNQGRLELHMNDRSKVQLNPEGVQVSVVASYAQKSAVRKALKELSAEDQNVEILATIVQVFEPRFFEVCPVCNKRMKLEGDKFTCATHTTSVPDYAYVMNLFLDDGSDNMRCVLWRDQVKELLAIPEEEIQAFRQDPAKFEPWKNELLGNMVKIIGRVNKNQAFDRMEFVASKITKNPNPDEEMTRLKEVSAKATQPVDDMDIPLKVEDV